MRSIRRTLLGRLFGGALVLLLAGAAALHAGVTWLLTDQFDTVLRGKLTTFTTLLEQEGEVIEIGFIDESMPELSAAVDPEYFQIWLQTGEVLYRSPSLGDVDLPRSFGTEDAPAIRDLDLPDGRAGRSIGAAFEIHHYEPSEDEEGSDEDDASVAASSDPGAAPVVISFAREREGLDAALALLVGGTVGGILLLLGGGVLVGRSAVRRGLLPLADLADHVGAIDDPVHAPRFPAETVPDELAPLAGSHNDMLDRIRRAFERERRTSANIAHELRTPVTELVILAEAAQRYTDDPRETARQLGELREIGGQMSALISTLLELARMESGHVPLEIEPVDLAEMVRASWSPFSAAAEAKMLSFHAPGGSGPIVGADRAALSILLANLLSNAVDHAPPGDEIRCEVSNGEQRGSLVLSNAANGLSAEDLDKLTEPFWRISPSREDRAHAGLGLSLVARLAALLELELSFQIEAGRFRARLGFPALPEG